MSLKPHLEELRQLMHTGGLRTEAAKLRGVEITLSASSRDYKTDPEAPMQTTDLLPRRLAWIRLIPADAAAAKADTAGVVDFIKKKWLAGLGKNYKGSFKPADAPRGKSAAPTYTGGPPAELVNPDAFRTAEIQVRQILASGDHKVVGTYKWDREKPDSWT
jgi:hypothetical protein